MSFDDRLAAAPDPELDALVEGAELDELLALVERRAVRADWDGLRTLSLRCRAAALRGRQLWGVAARADYRLALEGPGQHAAVVLADGTGRTAPGPLAEVAASSHTWAELSPHLADPVIAEVFAHERVVRGEDLTAAAHLPTPTMELPLALEPWEPAYALATYDPDGVRCDPPEGPERHEVSLPPPGHPVDDPDAVDALVELVRPWTATSNGRARAVAVEGDAATAVASLGPRRARMGALAPSAAVAALAWAAASGGARGRRRGAAAGRHSAWWTVAALAGALEDWPLEPREVGEIADELRWWSWDAYEPDTGWRLRLAVEDPADGLAWAVTAVDDWL